MPQPPSNRHSNNLFLKLHLVHGGLKMKLLALLACFTLYVGLAKAHVYEPCPSYWTKSGNSCYRYFGQAVSRIRALNICRMFSGCGGGIGHLVSINSAEENSFIFNLLKSFSGINQPPPQTWLGGRYFPATQQWQWSDGTLISIYTAWVEGQMPQQQDRRCMTFSNTPLPTWRDITCRGNSFPYVCEMPSDIPQDPARCAAAGPGQNPNQPVPFRYSKAGNVEQLMTGRA